MPQLHDMPEQVVTLIASHLRSHKSIAYLHTASRALHALTEEAMRPLKNLHDAFDETTDHMWEIFSRLEQTNEVEVGSFHRSFYITDVSRYDYRHAREIRIALRFRAFNFAYNIPIAESARTEDMTHRASFTPRDETSGHAIITMHNSDALEIGYRVPPGELLAALFGLPWNTRTMDREE